jgi:hypothetical protein
VPFTNAHFVFRHHQAELKAEHSERQITAFEEEKQRLESKIEELETTNKATRDELDDLLKSVDNL